MRFLNNFDKIHIIFLFSIFFSSFYLSNIKKLLFIDDLLMNSSPISLIMYLASFVFVFRPA
jgi:hypothetical protein